jgi:hypothetical protein
MDAPAKLFGYVFGAVYLLIGLVGFAVTGFQSFAAAEGPGVGELLVFQVNPLLNLVHILIGVALLAGAGAGELTARSLALLVGAAYAVVGVLGFFVVGNESLNILALDMADNWLHIGTAIVAFAAAAASKGGVAATA